MATTTPNFGWPVPTSTDLVKDGATAIEALGDGIDTSMVDLKGGLTGQVLAKATNADMDFSWVTTDDTNAIQNAIVDAKGDLIAASAADTPARLAVGANGETLVADSSTTTGLRYSAGTVQSNPVLNSAYQVWQRGTSVSIAASTTAYSADRWQVLANANQATTVSRQATGDSTNLPNIQYCARFQRNSGQTGTSNYFFANSFETINSIPYAGKTVTVSFYARKGADYTAASDGLFVGLNTATGTDQTVFNYAVGVASPIGSTVTLTSTWQRFSVSATLSSTLNEMAVFFRYTPVGTASTNDYFEITGVQVDIGSVALPFRTYAATIQGELAACQRYYYRVQPAAASAPITTSMYWSSSTIGIGTTQFPVKMRIIPTALEQSGTASDYAANYSTTTAVCSAIPIYENGSADMVQTRFTIASGATAGSGGYARQNSSGNAYLGWSAEL